MRLLKRFSKPGSAPGSLPSPQEDVQSRTHIARYDITRLEEPDLVALESVLPRNDETVWLDVEGHDVALIADLGARLGVHMLAIEDILNTGQRAKIEEYDQTLFFVVHNLQISDPSDADFQLESEQVAIALRPQVLFSVREHASPLFDQVRHRLRGGKPRIRGGGSGYLAYVLLDAVVDHYFPLLEQIGDRLEVLEEAILDEPSPRDLARLHSLRSGLAHVRRAIWPLREVLMRAVRSETALLGDEVRPFLRDVADHVALAADIVETYREMVASLTDLYMSSVSNRMNEVMKVLTIIATLFIPLSFIAGLYGMNFDPAVSRWNMPELGWYWGYPMALAIMAATAVGLVLFFRRKGWL
jgi:magnesium transporter